MNLCDDIATAFSCPGTCVGEKPCGSGHINETRLVYYQQHGDPTPYILQRINRSIFKNIPEMMENISEVTRHLAGKLQSRGGADVERRVLTLVPTVQGAPYHVDPHGEFWRMFKFIDGTQGYDVVENPRQAFEAARAIGEFQFGLTDLPGKLHETIPDFHHTRSRYDALSDAIQADPLNRAAEVKTEIDFLRSREAMVDTILDEMALGRIPERVTHNDTKLNNILLDSKTGEAVCVIDLDTVMPGSVLYDFGDMVRTMTSWTPEDERDLSRVNMDMEYFEALVNGYLDTASQFLVPEEKDLLAFSGKLITFEVGIRFLTDYIQGDLYFNTHRKGQNLDRCRSQFKLVQSMEEQEDAMRQVVEQYG